MKTFETPFVDVKKFDVMDVLTASAGGASTTEATEEEEPVIECVGFEID